MAERVGADHHERLLTVDDVLDFLPKMVQLQDEPIADPVCVPRLLRREAGARQRRHRLPGGRGRRRALLRLPVLEGLSGNLQRYDDLPVPRMLKRVGRRRAATPPARDERRAIRVPAPRRRGQPLFWGGAELHAAQKQRLLSTAPAPEFEGRTPGTRSRRFAHASTSRPGSPRRSHWMSYIDLNLRLPELLLMRVDKMTMGVGLEARVPFLDHEFVELAMSIPTDVRRANGKLKHMLKRAVRGVIPDELIDRPKQGFGVPVYEWFFDRLGDTAARASSRSSARRPTSSTATR